MGRYRVRETHHCSRSNKYDALILKYGSTFQRKKINTYLSFDPLPHKISRQCMMKRGRLWKAYSDYEAYTNIWFFSLWLLWLDDFKNEIHAKFRENEFCKFSILQISSIIIFLVDKHIKHTILPRTIMHSACNYYYNIIILYHI